MIYSFDPSLALPGKTFIRLLLPADYAYWDRLRDDPARYQAEKEKIAKTIISLLDKRYPGLAQQVEVWDVALALPAGMSSSSSPRMTGGRFWRLLLNPGRTERDKPVEEVCREEKPKRTGGLA